MTGRPESRRGLPRNGRSLGQETPVFSRGDKPPAPRRVFPSFATEVMVNSGQPGVVTVNCYFVKGSSGGSLASYDRREWNTGDVQSDCSTVDRTFRPVSYPVLGRLRRCARSTWGPLHSGYTAVNIQRLIHETLSLGRSSLGDAGGPYGSSTASSWGRSVTLRTTALPLGNGLCPLYLPGPLPVASQVNDETSTFRFSRRRNYGHRARRGSCSWALLGLRHSSRVATPLLPEHH